jgi:hypothetical protein|nr:hypothetical protein [Kofleriaceae bacterium]
MRLLIGLALAAAACGGYSTPSDDQDPGGFDSGCQSDTTCSPDVCARDGECLPASDVRSIRVTWTVDGSAANATSCTTIPSLFLEFNGGPQDGVGFAPVPCMEGNFSVDKMPSRFDDVQIGIDNGGFLGDSEFDGSGDVSFDLQP